MAASNRPAAGDLPLPSQDGADRPFTNLDTHDFSLQTQGAQPQAQPKETPQAESKPTAATTPPPKSKPSEPPSPRSSRDAGPGTIRLLTSTPPPPLKAPEEAEPSPPPMWPLRPRPSLPGPSRRVPLQIISRKSSRPGSRAASQIAAPPRSMPSARRSAVTRNKCMTRSARAGISAPRKSAT